MHRLTLFIFTAFLATTALVAQPPAPPPARAIPGITAPEMQPQACVSCHINMPDIGIDARLSTAMSRWTVAVDPKLLAKAQGSMGNDVTLEGKHPAVPEALDSIPANCLDCHAGTSDVAPPFRRMMHAIHLTGGEENHFLTIFQGECTHCHKLNSATGEWSVPSGREH